MGGPIRLDLGAGTKRTAGWISVDLAVERTAISQGGVLKETKVTLDPDVVSDIRTLPFPDDFANLIRSIHVVEHFYVWEVPDILAEWARVLEPGGALILECPCLEKILKLYDVPNIPPYMTFWGLYGDPRLKDPLMTHKWCYTSTQLLGLMQEAGLVDIRQEPAQSHQPVRDMRLIGFKPKAEPILARV
jgi:predicted SAM-dependent methyltransferase